MIPTPPASHRSISLEPRPAFRLSRVARQWSRRQGALAARPDRKPPSDAPRGLWLTGEVVAEVFPGHTATFIAVHRLRIVDPARLI